MMHFTSGLNSGLENVRDTYPTFQKQKVKGTEKSCIVPDKIKCNKIAWILSKKFPDGPKFSPSGACGACMF